MGPNCLCNISYKRENIQYKTISYKIYLQLISPKNAPRVNTDHTIFGGVLTAKRGCYNSLPKSLNRAPPKLMRNPGYSPYKNNFLEGPIYNNCLQVRNHRCTRPGQTHRLPGSIVPIPRWSPVAAVRFCYIHSAVLLKRDSGHEPSD